ncbi:MAG: hypothetical protein HY301_12370 [Verrucomicrobia bacterium]|nr:hypothetical protein [Verrucomicrobiota bacterium]
MRKHRVQSLLMGGQACVFYGAAQFSKDVDLVLPTDPLNDERLHAALAELKADRIAVPKFDPAALARGHAVHFRCSAPGVEGLRVDLMTRHRCLPEFSVMWERRTQVGEESDIAFDIMAVEDLVQAKKTQREKDWPMISALVSAHYLAFASDASPQRIDFWLREARTPELLVELCRKFPTAAAELMAARPLLHLAQTNDLDALRTALDAEVRAEQARDRAYWEPLRKELEAFRRAERIN